MAKGALKPKRRRSAWDKKFRAHWSVFLPTIAVTVLYGSAFVWLWGAGEANGALARVCLLVLAVGVPMLFVHAGLRFTTTRLRIGKRAVIMRLGWPRRRLDSVKLREITRVDLRRGIAGRLFDTGTVVLITRTGVRHSISDIAAPQSLVAALRAAPAARLLRTQAGET